MKILVKSMEKKDIRKRVFAKRKELSMEALDQKSQLICEKIMEMDAFVNASSVYVYMDCKGEVSTKPLIEAAWKIGKKVAAPKVHGEEMTYYYISSYDDVAPGYYDIPEPVTSIEAEEEDALLIVPGVGFDAKRHRCGYGKGFYDRFLAAHPGFTTVAAAFEFQLFDEVPFEETDVLPQMLVTEQKIYR